MKARTLRTWEDLEALPEGQWVQVEGGISVQWIDKTTPRRRARVVIPITRRLAKSLTPKKGEILEAQVEGDRLVLVRRKGRRKTARSRGA
jgi:hypothetical protein